MSRESHRPSSTGSKTRLAGFPDLVSCAGGLQEAQTGQATTQSASIDGMIPSGNAETNHRRTSAGAQILHFLAQQEETIRNVVHRQLRVSPTLEHSQAASTSDTQVISPRYEPQESHTGTGTTQPDRCTETVEADPARPQTTWSPQTGTVTPIPDSHTRSDMSTAAMPASDYFSPDEACVYDRHADPHPFTDTRGISLGLHQAYESGESRQTPRRETRHVTPVKPRPMWNNSTKTSEPSIYTAKLSLIDHPERKDGFRPSDSSRVPISKKPQLPRAATPRASTSRPRAVRPILGNPCDESSQPLPPSEPPTMTGYAALHEKQDALRSAFKYLQAARKARADAAALKKLECAGPHSDTCPASELSALADLVLTEAEQMEVSATTTIETVQQPRQRRILFPPHDDRRSASRNPDVRGESPHSSNPSQEIEGEKSLSRSSSKSQLTVPISPTSARCDATIDGFVKLCTCEARACIQHSERSHSRSRSRSTTSSSWTAVPVQVQDVYFVHATNAWQHGLRNYDPTSPPPKNPDWIESSVAACREKERARHTQLESELASPRSPSARRQPQVVSSSPNNLSSTFEKRRMSTPAQESNQSPRRFSVSQPLIMPRLRRRSSVFATKASSEALKSVTELSRPTSQKEPEDPPQGEAPEPDARHCANDADALSLSWRVEVLSGLKDNPQALLEEIRASESKLLEQLVRRQRGLNDSIALEGDQATQAEEECNISSSSTARESPVDTDSVGKRRLSMEQPNKPQQQQNFESPTLLDQSAIVVLSVDKSTELTMDDLHELKRASDALQELATTDLCLSVGQVEENRLQQHQQEPFQQPQQPQQPCQPQHPTANLSSAEDDFIELDQVTQIENEALSPTKGPGHVRKISRSDLMHRRTSSRASLGSPSSGTSHASSRATSPFPIPASVAPPALPTPSTPSSLHTPAPSTTNSNDATALPDDVKDLHDELMAFASNLLSV